MVVYRKAAAHAMYHDRVDQWVVRRSGRLIKVGDTYQPLYPELTVTKSGVDV